VPLWITITIAAALFQNIRTTMQQKIRGVLSVDGANFVRYLYGAPLALGMLAFLVWGTGRTIPSISLFFLLLVTIAGLAQIIATSLMIHAFSLRNYTVGTVYSKTETLFVALFATFIASEPLHFLSWMGILVCLGGVFILSVRGKFSDVRGALRPTAACACHHPSFFSGVRPAQEDDGAILSSRHAYALSSVSGNRK